MDVQFLSAMNPTAGSFEICERLQRHFATFSCQMPSVADLKLIYSSILSGHTLGWGDAVSTMCSRIVDASIGIHSMVSGSEQTLSFVSTVRRATLEVALFGRKSLTNLASELNDVNN